jgi:LPPG:FO 2-phospho-L-lactate transferase
LAEGFYRSLGSGLTVIVNTGDDWEPYGLAVCPDLDSVLYALSGELDHARGWGRRDETAYVRAELIALGEDAWFHLYDRDLAVHLIRTGWLAEGARPTTVARRLCAALRVQAAVLPGTDAHLRTQVRTPAGWLDFQDWFVRDRCTPDAEDVRYAGVESALPTPEVLAALATARLIVIGPSNPYLSIGPLLHLAGIRAAMIASPAPVVAVSPVIGGRALKGPTARMLERLAGESGVAAVARVYRDVLDGLVIDREDAAWGPELERGGLRVHVTDASMPDAAARGRLAEEVYAFGESITADHRRT